MCSFAPPLDDHPDAAGAANHANVDSDEVLFYCDGDFTSRKGAGIGAGSISLHPGGFTHGPQPGSVEASLGAESTDELAVMVDTFASCALSGRCGHVRTRAGVDGRRRDLTAPHPRHRSGAAAGSRAAANAASARLSRAGRAAATTSAASERSTSRFSAMTRS